MAKSQASKLKLFKDLLSQLVDYGLNPDDWQVATPSARPSEVQLLHRLDRDFQLIGFVAGERTNKAYWRGLYIKSI